jgi:hypothetical protein
MTLLEAVEPKRNAPHDFGTGTTGTSIGPIGVQKKRLFHTFVVCSITVDDHPAQSRARKRSRVARPYNCRFRSPCSLLPANPAPSEIRNCEPGTNAIGSCNERR